MSSTKKRNTKKKVTTKKQVAPKKQPAKDQPLDKKSALKKSKVWLICLIILASLLILGGIIWHAVSVNLERKQKEHEQELENIVSFCENLFDETTAIKNDTSEDDLKKCSNRLTELKSKKDASSEENDAEKDQIDSLSEQISNAFTYLDWNDTANELISSGEIVKDSIEEKDLVSLDESLKGLADAYKETASEKLSYLRSEYLAMKDAKDTVNNLFTSEDHTEVRPDINRNLYNETKEKIDNLKQESLRQNLSEQLENVLPVIEEKERIARELAEKARREREEELRKIAASWHNLDLSPYYINQISAGFESGCEAASLLMSMKYKGYGGGISFSSFANNMPKSDTDPNQGFYLSMTSLEPRDEAHWIAPAPLASYGVASGGSVANVSGWSLDQLDNEVKNGNPVIIYLTFGFNNPKEYSKGVPRNLHVLVLSGFNSYTGEQKFYDPWPVNGNNPSLSKARTEQLYNASGRRALVVR
ncbi:C39 family peptidase [Candidatus Saccharibacteria bacterium]|nr:C39 family peptidase [Candidatus Saccharibacteria bacterium]